MDLIWPTRRWISPTKMGIRPEKNMWISPTEMRICDQDHSWTSRILTTHQGKTKHDLQGEAPPSSVCWLSSSHETSWNTSGAQPRWTVSAQRRRPKSSHDPPRLAPPPPEAPAAQLWQVALVAVGVSFPNWGRYQTWHGNWKFPINGRVILGNHPQMVDFPLPCLITKRNLEGTYTKWNCQYLSLTSKRLGVPRLGGKTMIEIVCRAIRMMGVEFTTPLGYSMTYPHKFDMEPNR